MNTIKLSSEVMVSDPCYTPDTWCLTKLTNVLPGTYMVKAIITDLGDWGRRCSGLVAVHQDFVGKNKRWYHHSNIGVDSGQAGIFDSASYRNDDIVESIVSPNVDFFLPVRRDEGGDQWYEKMCKFTLSENSWGAYDGGVVSSSGIGDGMYGVSVLKDKGMTVGISIDYSITDTQKEFIESLQFGVV